MDDSRRKFLKIAGAAIVGAGCVAPLASATESAESAEPGKGTYSSSKRKAKGKKWAMVIDIGKCLQKSGCTACFDACHKAHNVPEISIPRQEVKWIWKEEYKHTFPTQVHEHTESALKDKPVPVLCNHCEEPPCVRVCPVQATWKNEEDGIVMMDMHRCIGCRYCLTACPYGSRSFNFSDPRPKIANITPDYPTRTKGVAEKCNFCAERLAVGKQPACVEACKNTAGAGALVFGDLTAPNSNVARILKRKHTIRRKPNLGTGPQVYYVV